MSIGKVRASTQTVMKGAIATIPQSEMTENPLRAGSRTSAIISARMSETLKAAEESNPLLGTENTWDEVEAYDDPGGSVRKEYLVNELILHETKKDIQKIHAEIGEEMEKNLNHSTKKKSDEELALKQLKKTMKRAASEINIKSENEIVAMHGPMMDRVMKIDEEVREIAQRGKLDNLEKDLIAMMTTMGYEVMCSVRTVAFLNVPRRGDRHVGEGFLIMTKQMLPKTPKKGRRPERR